MATSQQEDKFLMQHGSNGPVELLGRMTSMQTTADANAWPPGANQEQQANHVEAWNKPGSSEGQEQERSWKFDRMRQLHALDVERRSRLLRREAERDATDLVAASSAPTAPGTRVSSHQEREVATDLDAASSHRGSVSSHQGRVAKAAIVPSVSATSSCDRLLKRSQGR